jgi:hypothetical protein
MRIKRDMYKRLPVGYVVYAYSFYSLEYHLCKWYAYPIFRLIEKAKGRRAQFYGWLNRRGIMHTPECYAMKLSDIWRTEE